MDWQVAIDIRAWESDFTVLESVLSYARAKPWLKILFSEQLYPVISTNYQASWVIYKLLEGVNLDSYSKRPVSVNVAFSPDILDGLNQREMEETEDVAYSMLHQGGPPHKLYEMSELRPNVSTATVLTVTDGTSSKHIGLIIASKGESLEHFFSQNNPKLVQAKHNPHQSRNLGKGKVASTFKAWNPNDESYAKHLLQIAFMDSGSQDFPPSPIYTWDSKNEVYVRFMHSGNWEYHGHDLEDFNEVPENIKKRYNHWKK